MSRLTQPFSRLEGISGMPETVAVSPGIVEMVNNGQNAIQTASAIVGPIRVTPGQRARNSAHIGLLAG
jgi:hypothetical protein